MTLYLEELGSDLRLGMRGVYPTRFRERVSFKQEPQRLRSAARRKWDAPVSMGSRHPYGSEAGEVVMDFQCRYELAGSGDTCRSS